MRTLLPAIGLGVSLCASTGCKRPVDPAQLAELDGLIASVDSAARALNAIDTRRLHELDSAYALQRDTVLSLLKDTVNVTTATALGNYHRSMSTTLDRVVHEFDRVSEELAHTRTQLEQLKHDVQHGLLPPEQGPAFISQEKAFAERTVNNARVLTSSAGTVISTWTMYHGLVDTVLRPRPIVPQP